MKTYWLIVWGFFVLVAVGSWSMRDVKAQVLYASPDNSPKEAYAGHYLLVHRYWGSCNTIHGDAISTYQCWDYLKDFYDTKDEALKALEEANGPNYPRINAAEFVGIFKLEPSVMPDDMKFSEGDHVQKHEVEEKEHWFKWEKR